MIILHLRKNRHAAPQGQIKWTEIKGNPKEQGLVFKWFGCSARDPKVPSSIPETAKVVTRGQRTCNNNLQSHYSSTTNYINSIFCYIHQTEALQLLQHFSSPNSQVCDAFHSTKVYDAFHSIKPARASAHQQSGQQSAHMHAAHHFLDIQIISNKLGVVPVDHHATPSYSDVYKPISTSGHWEFLLSSG
ncbi:hypothetical protein AVEN_145788-1 [Araneus ventricosus]|uniref:Uncharacterized protein n=1 Tax=Araneus ventricosus TaxID=182803 RepID=A0A4Y2VVC9_ARAVE|nr:hypothetical protein AVEN_145788-1 [Araneus ventricosus]